MYKHESPSQQRGNWLQSRLTTWVLLVGKSLLTAFPYRESHFFGPLLVFLFYCSAKNSLRISWGYEVAWAISRTKDNELSAFYHRMVRRLGKKQAITAVAHKVPVIIYHILRTKTPYKDLGAEYFDQKDRSRIQRHHVQRLEQLGYTVTLNPKEAA